MYPKHDVVMRPMIDCRRADVSAWLMERGLPSVHDETNDDLTIPRNRVRAELLPVLEQRFNPNVAEVLAAEATLAQDEHLFLDALAFDWARLHVRRERRAWRAERTALAALPLALRRYVLFQALVDMAGERPVGFDDVERAVAVVSGELPGFDAPGQRVERVGEVVVLRSEPPGRRALPKGQATSDFWYPLAVPGEAALPEVGAAVSAELLEAGTSAEMSNRGHFAHVRADLVRGGLAVRNRRPGDRLKPSPAGHRKLQDLLVDRKVPRAERDRIPVVVDLNGRIVWVVGHAIDTGFRVTDPTQPMVVLRFKVVGGSF
jgi:tRNA(Ile)-lysidine synthase